VAVSGKTEKNRASAVFSHVPHFPGAFVNASTDVNRPASLRKGRGAHPPCIRIAVAGEYGFREASGFTRIGDGFETTPHPALSDDVEIYGAPGRKVS